MSKSNEPAPERATNRKARRAAACRHGPPPYPDALAYTVGHACRMAGFGRTLLYKLAKEGKLRLLKVAGRTLVCGDSLRALIAGRDA
jgi:hypothetical protein